MMLYSCAPCNPPEFCMFQISECFCICKFIHSDMLVHMRAHTHTHTQPHPTHTQTNTNISTHTDAHLPIPKPFHKNPSQDPHGHNYLNPFTAKVAFLRLPGTPPKSQICDKTMWLCCCSNSSLVIEASKLIVCTRNGNSPYFSLRHFD